jgi:hypothetical protein
MRYDTGRRYLLAERQGVGMRRLEKLLVVGVLSALAVGMGACESGDSGGGGESAATVTKTETAPAPDSSAQGSSGDESASGGGSDENWEMPDETGKDLQGAQDDIQSVTDGGIFYSDSHDVSGQDREQVLDRNWQVCTQDPAPGTEITPDTKIDFGVVRDTEQCP